MKNKTWIWVLVALIVAVGGYFLWTWLALGNDATSNNTNTDEKTISSFEECIEAGHPVMESSPRQCAVPDGETFVEEFSENEEESAETRKGKLTSKKGVNIKVDITEGETIASPFEVRGEVPGSWSFEADFPIELVDSEGHTLVETYATLEGDWMTEDLVPFSTELEFPNQPPGSTGTLVLHKDNPSELSENDDRLEVDVTF